MLRMSKLFLRTLREDPADAETVSHRLLVRAGHVRRVAGDFSWLPLGLLAQRNVERIIREEFDRIGAQEVSLPALGAPHEVFATLVEGEYSSYKDFPITLYRIQPTHRARPRAGLLRGHELVTMDACSFEVTDGQTSYEAHRSALINVLDRLGLAYRTVSGGLTSEHFIATSDAGEDTFVACESCNYAATTQTAQIQVPHDQLGHELAEQQVLDTPDTPTIETLVDCLRVRGHDVTAAQTLKNVVLKARRLGEDTWELLVVGVPGDREVDLDRLASQLPNTELAQAEAEDLALQPGLVKGYIGPQVLASLGVRYLVDPLVTLGSSWATGANESGRHAINVVRGRDFDPDGEVYAAQVRDGDTCASCGGLLRLATGIEIGSISEPVSAAALEALGPEGKPIPVAMGSYGIEVSGCLVALAEQHHDAHGLTWPRGVAPADVHVVATGNAGQPEVAATLSEELERGGFRVLLDDRTGVSAGVKFTDSELIGVPTIVVVGKRLVDGLVEVRDRLSGAREDVAVSDVIRLLSR
jgi:prolyl-tRNA synthetase